jgi:hypothetical protein
MFLPCTIPDGQSGAWRVERCVVSEDEARIENMRSAFSRVRQLPVRPGTYVRLVGPGGIWMSDTPSELSDNSAPIRQAGAVGGHCLVTGLGLGLVTEALLAIQSVTRVTVIEREPDVIALVGPTLRERWGDRLEIVQADALTWRPPRGVRYSVVWHDIWLHICADNQASMTTLKRRYARRADWQRCWREESVRKVNREDRKAARQMAFWKRVRQANG